MKNMSVFRWISGASLFAMAVLVGPAAQACPSTCGGPETGCFGQGKWKDFANGRVVCNQARLTTGFDSQSQNFFIGVEPLGNAGCIAAQGIMDSQPVPGCFVECVAAPEGGNCTIAVVDDATCSNTDTGFGPVNEVDYTVETCNPG
ncbi:MAG: hypothetical protein M3O36_02220 [Myxococcota bacterium]|nr:hypothetical protein [Myxococcota bacterium]